jgi:CRP-like cAMP-binding protein
LVSLLFVQYFLLEARVASITAIEDSQLLRLEREPFYELMEDRIEVARGIIQVLSRRLRDRIRDVNELRSRLESSRPTLETVPDRVA